MSINQVRSSILLLLFTGIILASGSAVYRYGSVIYRQERAGQIVFDRLRQRVDSTGDDFACGPIDNTSNPSPGNSGLEKAIKYLEASLETGPLLSRSYFLLGRSYCLSGKHDLAIEPLTEFTRIRPENPLGFIELGLALETICLGSQSLESSSTEVAQLTQLCSSAPEQLKIRSAWISANVSPEEFIRRGDLEVGQGRLEYALAWYGRALTMDASYGLVWEKIARLLEDQEQNAQAMFAHEQAIDLGVTASVRSLAQLYRSQTRNQDSIVLLQSSLTKFPNAADRRWWWKTLGDLLLQEQDWEKALEIAKQADREYPNDPDLLINLGTAMYEVEANVDAARDIFQQAISLDLDRGDGFYAMGRLYAQEQSFQEADRWFSQALDKDPTNLWWRLGWANAMRDWGMISKAVNYYQEILIQSPTFDIALVELAWTYRLSGQRDLAFRTVEEALDLMDPPKAWYYQRAGQIYEWGNEIEKARQAYLSALALDAGNRVAIQGLQRLRVAE